MPFCDPELATHSRAEQLTRLASCDRIQPRLVVVRLVDLMAGLSRFADLGFGLPVSAHAQAWKAAPRAGAVCALTGDDIPVGARIARLTGIAVMFESIGGSELASATQHVMWDSSHHVRVAGALSLCTGVS